MASKQLWRWRGITGDGNAQDGMLWAESRALLLMALQQQMVTPLSLKRIAINSAQWRGDKSAEVIHQLATLLKAGLTLSEGLALLAEQHPSKQWQALAIAGARSRTGHCFFQCLITLVRGISAALSGDDPHG